MAKSTICLVFSLFIAVLSQRDCKIKDKSDPCKRYNTRDIPYLDSRHPSVQYTDKTADVNKYCDLYALDDGVWYISDYNITQTCVQQESCGSRLPIWLNGTIPTSVEGAVNRSACLRTYDGCCAKSYKLMVKNCIFYNVYCFWNLPYDCPERYCFDVDLSKVTTTTTTTTTTTKTTSTTSSPSATTQKVPTTSETADKAKRNDGNGDRNVIIGLSSAVVVSVSAVVVLSGLVVVLKKKLATSVLPNPVNGEKIAIY